MSDESSFRKFCMGLGDMLQIWHDKFVLIVCIYTKLCVKLEKHLAKC